MINTTLTKDEKQIVILAIQQVIDRMTELAQVDKLSEQGYQVTKGMGKLVVDCKACLHDT